MGANSAIERLSAGLKALVPSAVLPLGSALMSKARESHDRYFYERPGAAFRKSVVERSQFPGFAGVAGELDRNGIVFVPAYFSGDRLAAMQREFQRLVESNPPGHGEEKNSFHVSTKRIGESALFSELGFEPLFVDLAEYYWGKPVHLIGTGGTRLDPYGSNDDYGSYQWHHDAKRKQFRIMILLCEVPESGQHMDFIPGTHREFRRDLVNSRIDPNAAAKQGAPVHCCGPAGTVVAFDTNGTHRGNRNNGPRRDHWQYTYRAPGSVALGDLSPLRLHPDVAVRLTKAQRRLALAGDY